MKEESPQARAQGPDRTGFLHWKVLQGTKLMSKRSQFLFGSLWTSVFWVETKLFNRAFCGPQPGQHFIKGPEKSCSKEPVSSQSAILHITLFSYIP